MSPEERKTIFGWLAEPHVDWETAKRLINQGHDTFFKLQLRSDIIMGRMVVTTTCGCCGHEGINVPRCDDPDHPFDEVGMLMIHEVECPKCNAKCTGGNGATGECNSWMTEGAMAKANAIFEAQNFDVEMNEMFGRGNW